MNAGPTFVSHIEAAKTIEPGQRAFHDPPRATEPTAMGRATLGELGVDPASMQRIAVRLRIVSSVAPKSKLPTKIFFMLHLLTL